MKRIVGATAALTFLAGLALGIAGASSFPGWGRAPEFALAALTLKKITLFGHPILSQVSGVSAVLPMSSYDFTVSLIGAFLFAFSLVFIFLSLTRLTRDIAVGVAAVVAFAFFPGAAEMFGTASAFGWTVFSATMMFHLYVSFTRTGGWHLFALFALVSSLNIFHSFFLFAVCIALTVLMLAEKFKQPDGHERSQMFAFSFVGLAGLSINLFLLLRPSLVLNFSLPLAGWVSVSSKLPEMLLGSVNMDGSWFRILALAKTLTGVFIPFFIAAAAAPILAVDRNRKTIIAFFALFMLSIFIVIGSQWSDAKSATVVCGLMLVIVGTAAIPSIVERLAGSDGKASLITSRVLMFVLAAYALHGGFGSVVGIRPADAEQYYEKIFRTMRRDATLYIDSKDDPLYGLSYIQQTRNLRPDTVFICLQDLSSRPYRENLRKRGNRVRIPSEKEYDYLKKQVASMAPQALTGRSALIMKQRLEDGISTLVEENLMLNSFLKWPVYMNRIERVLSSRMFGLMQFEPTNYLFFLRSDEQRLSFKNIAAGMLPAETSDKVTNRNSAIFFENMGENFFKQEMNPHAYMLFDKALEYDPDNIPSNFFLGILSKKMGDYDKSFDFFNKTLRLLDEKSLHGKQELNDLFMYQRVYIEMNNKEKAAKYQQLLEPGSMPGTSGGANK